VDSFKYHSEENVSVAVSESSPPVSIGAQVGLRFTPVASQPQLQYHQHHLQPRPADDHRAVTDDHNTTLSILKQLEQGREMQVELQEVIADLQVDICLCLHLVYLVYITGSAFEYLWMRFGLCIISVYLGIFWDQVCGIGFEFGRLFFWSLHFSFFLCSCCRCMKIFKVIILVIFGLVLKMLWLLEVNLLITSIGLFDAIESVTVLWRLRMYRDIIIIIILACCKLFKWQLAWFM